MGVTHVLDDYYLAITFLISVGIQGGLFAITFGLQTDKFIDLGGSLNFFVLAIFTLCGGGTYDARNIIASVAVMIWSTRLGSFLFYRVLKTGKDGRFDDMRSKFISMAGFFTFQLLWCWIVSFPVTILNSPRVSDVASGGGSVKFGSARDIAGLIIFILGFSIETLADFQKLAFKTAKPPKSAINEKGVWKFSRHPNFFGEIFLWWGLWILSLEPAVARVTAMEGRRALYASVVGPLFITLLLFFVSGLPLAEKPTAKRYYLQSHGMHPAESGDPWASYKRHLSRTSILIPIPPALYAPLPKIVKKTLLLDFPMFTFSESKDGPQAQEEERKKADEEA